MTDNSCHDTAEGLARDAMVMMQTHHIAPTPENFKLFYENAKQQDHDLCGAIDAIIATGISSGDGFSPEKLVELFQRFFGIEAELDAMRSISSELQQTMSRVQSRMNESLTEQSNFGDKLDGVSEQLAGPAGELNLHAIVDSLIEDTQSIVSRNRELEGHLATSLKQIGKLEGDLTTVRQEALTDGLTDLFNRRHFDAELVRLTAEAATGENSLALMMIDIDHFKIFNDTYGHKVGDHVLRRVAARISAATKGRDVPARFGGEEFAVLLPLAGREAAAALAEEIRSDLASKELTNKRTGEKLGKVTVSIGVAQYVRGEEPDSLVHRADEALYRAKSDGRNRVEAAKPVHLAQMEARTQVAS